MRGPKSKTGRFSHNSAMVTLDAPKVIDLYNPRNRAKSSIFISSIVNAIKSPCGSDPSTRRVVHINLRCTELATAAAVLSMISSVEFALNNVKGAKPRFRVTRPHAVNINGGKDRVRIVDSVLNRLGFYAALGFKQFTSRELANVKCWDIIRGVKVNSDAAGQMLQAVETSLVQRTGGKAQRLFGPLVEAMNNVVEHAYFPAIWKGEQPEGHRWWCFTALVADQLTVLIGDKGVGISATLEQTQPKGLLDLLKQKVGGVFSNDADYIMAAMDVKRTRTSLSHRGNGGKDLKSAIEKIPNSRLTVISNKGVYRYHHVARNGNDPVLNESRESSEQSIVGTIVEWTIPLPKGVLK
ncbi:hypothetical protein [Aeromonas sobria]|uniref:hypothetical protein n=1 Tax=Aeromonas sobria TaxID=646 RepID=UPI00111A7FDF|nr:hypothetical protein [Aeromonas sobria]